MNGPDSKSGDLARGPRVQIPASPPCHLMDQLVTRLTDALVQTCIVHLIRHSMAYGSWKERKAIAVGRVCRSRPCRAGGVRGRRVGPEVSGYREELALQLGADHPVLRLLYADQARDLHDQCDRELEQHGATRRSDPWPLPERSGRDQAHLPGAAERIGKMETAAAVLEPCALRVCDPLRRAVYDGERVSNHRVTSMPGGSSPSRSFRCADSSLTRPPARPLS